MTQTRTGSAVETVANVVLGNAINVTMNLTLLPWAFDLHPTVGDAAGMSVVFTIISVVRSYCLRRAMNRIRRFHA
jgi:hypothetical protein